MKAMDEPRGSNARDEGAVFAPVQVRKARRPRILAAAAVVALGGLIAVGALDRLAQPHDADVAVLADEPATAIPTESTRSSRPPPRGPVASPIVHGRAEFSLLDLDVRPAGSHLFVHGDVFAIDIVRVAVTLEDAAGHVAAIESIDIPGGSRAFLLGAVPRFDAHFFLPDEVRADGFVVSATALDAGGQALVTITRSVARSTETM